MTLFGGLCHNLVPQDEDYIVKSFSSYQPKPKPNQSTETGFIASASFLISSNRTDDRYLSPKLA